MEEKMITTNTKIYESTLKKIDKMINRKLRLDDRSKVIRYIIDCFFEKEEKND